jgi:hypothetical protein
MVAYRLPSSNIEENLDGKTIYINTVSYNLDYSGSLGLLNEVAVSAAVGLQERGNIEHNVIYIRLNA